MYPAPFLVETDGIEASLRSASFGCFATLSHFMSLLLRLRRTAKDGPSVRSLT